MDLFHQCIFLIFYNSRQEDLYIYQIEQTEPNIFKIKYFVINPHPTPRNHIDLVFLLKIFFFIYF